MLLLSPGQCIDSYRLARPIGKGGFGTVWLAYSEAMGDPVALKVLDQGSTEGGAQELAGVKTYKAKVVTGGDSGLMPIEHVGLVEGIVFYVMPLADGESDALKPEESGWHPRTLAACIEQQRHATGWFKPTQIHAWLAPICTAAQALADAGLVHRDIKPDNILFQDGHPVLSDVSLLRTDSLTLTRIGTPGYSAPSWYAETGGKLDMFSLAATLFTLLTGHSPDKIGRAAFRWPPQGEASLSPAMRAAWLHFHRIVLRATHEDPTERYLTFTSLSDDLRRGAALGECTNPSDFIATTPAIPETPSSPVITLRVRISAPSDVEAEREAAQEVIDRISRLYRPNLSLELVNSTSASAPESTDLMIGILWSQLDDRIEPAAISEETASTGTARELLDFHKTTLAEQAPDLMLFVKTATPPVGTWSADAGESALRRHQGVQELLATLTNPSPSASGGVAPTHFSDTAAFSRLLELHLRQWLDRYAPLPDSSVSGGTLWTEGNPYRGLAPFDPEHAAVFFGRDAARVQAWQRLTQPGGGFLLVVGGSGTGKSSFVRAGLIPHLPPVLPGGQAASWSWAITTPSGGGLGPMAGLLDVLRQRLPDWRHGLDRDDALLASLRATPSAFGLLLAQTLAGKDSPDGQNRRLFLLVDQGEELFSPSIIESERTAYIAALESLLATGRIWIAMTLRADRYGELQRVPALLALKDGRQLDLAPPSSTEMAEIILRPAQAAGLAFEFRQGRFLNQTIAEEARHFGECLPLLQFALSRLYEAAQSNSGRRLLTYAAYAQIGGLSGAIARHAALVETSLRATLGEATSIALGRLFAALVRGDTTDQGLPLRRHAPLSELGTQAETRTALEHLVTHRLLATGGDPERPMVTLAHEVLLTQWPSLAQWLSQHRRTLQDRARLEPQAQLWLTQGKRPDLLLPEGQSLALAEDVLKAIEVAPDLRDYIETSRAFAVSQRNAAEKHQQRRIRQWAVAAFVGLGLAVLATLFGLSASKARQATQKEQIHTQEALKIAETRTDQLQQYEDTLTENLSPLIYAITTQSGDAELTLKANEFLNAIKWLFKPKYNPASFKKSYQAGQFCLIVANAVVQSQSELLRKTLLSLPISVSDEARIRKALNYGEQAEAIFRQMRQSPTLTADLSQVSLSQTEFENIIAEAKMVPSLCQMYLKNFPDAIRLYTELTKTISGWDTSAATSDEAKAFDLFECYTNLAQCYRLSGNLTDATRTMALALDAGESAIKTKPNLQQNLILRYALADYLKILDADHSTKYQALLEREKITPSEMRELILQLLASDTPATAPKTP